MCALGLQVNPEGISVLGVFSFDVRFPANPSSPKWLRHVTGTVRVWFEAGKVERCHRRITRFGIRVT